MTTESCRTHARSTPLQMGLLLIAWSCTPAVNGAGAQHGDAVGTPGMACAVGRVGADESLSSGAGGRLYIEPDQVVVRGRRVTIIGQSGLAVESGQGARRVAALEFSNAGAVADLSVPGDLPPSRLMRLAELDDASILVSSDSPRGSAPWTLRAHERVKGQWSLARLIHVPIPTPRHTDVTALVRARDHVWMATARTLPDGQRVAIVVTMNRSQAIVDSVPLAGIPVSLTALEDTTTDIVSLAYSAARWRDGAYGEPEMILTQFDRMRRALVHTVIAEADGREQVLARVAGSAPNWTLLWATQVRGQLLPEVIEGARSGDGGRSWRPTPALPLPAGLLDFRVTAVSRDLTLLAAVTTPERTGLTAALLTRDRWSSVLHELREAPISTPVPISAGAAWAVAFGTVDGPLDKTVPSLRRMVVSWSCP